MGHLREIKKEYKDLQKRLDMNPVGAPESKYLYDILRIMFSEEQARIASEMPMIPATLDKISRRTGITEKKLEAILNDMAGRGLVMDFSNNNSGKTYYILAPTVVGFFEFSMMRERTDIPQKELSEAMYHYLYDSMDFANEIFQKHTQLGRALVHETALVEDELTEVLDWERASMIIENSQKRGVSLCYCRHKARHMEKACGRPEEICMTFDAGAEWLARKNLGREISKSEALDLLEIARENGMVQTADNVMKEPGFICNCCGCCCGMLGAINKHGLTHAVHTSGFIAAIDMDKCKGCGKCARSCPISVITINEKIGENGRKVKWAEIDQSICLGCGVCERSCKFNGLWMKKRKNRKILTPESTLERVIMMSIERGKLQNFLFDDIDGPSADFLKTLAGVVLKLPVTKRLLLSKEVKSRFLDFITSRAEI